MKIDILFNDQAMNSRFLEGHGFSCLLDRHLLFDTGLSPEVLLKNMKTIGADTGDIGSVVISHDHQDHTGGLWEILRIRKGLKVHACPNFSQEFKDKVKAFCGILIEHEKPFEISKNIFLTGEIPGIYKGKSMPEQSLAVKTELGISVITGCAHPGIINILRRARSLFPSEDFYSVFGGFHLHDKNKMEINDIVAKFQAMNVKKAGPTHCSGNAAEKIFTEKYMDNFIEVRAGQVFNI
ncbi:MAG: MBL fold metallo-hydrolase [Candidatus Orphnella occulta]|nr:MBL fold metallo-hydrolase [Candidatus Orphnella occulta]MDP8297320.1 MBL fold metallo-hydrolase [Candidatus Orphnella occulta]